MCVDHSQHFGDKHTLQSELGESGAQTINNNNNK